MLTGAIYINKVVAPFESTPPIPPISRTSETRYHRWTIMHSLTFVNTLMIDLGLYLAKFPNIQTMSAYPFSRLAKDVALEME